MISPCKQVLKKPDWKTLKFSGEEKSRRTITLRPAACAEVLDIVSPKTAAGGFKKPLSVDARDQ